MCCRHASKLQKAFLDRDISKAARQFSASLVKRRKTFSAITRSILFAKVSFFLLKWGRIALEKPYVAPRSGDMSTARSDAADSFNSCT